MKLIAVFVENQPGRTARVARVLAEAGVNIHWVANANSGSFGVMKLLVDKLEPAVTALKAHGLMVSLLESLAVEVADKPGSLQAIAEMLEQKEQQRQASKACLSFCPFSPLRHFEPQPPWMSCSAS
jgi:hypothetical protein